MIIPALTIWQPWASLLACGVKLYETRGWATSYMGPIAIHAGKKLDYPMELYFGEQADFWKLAGDALCPGWDTFRQVFDNAKALPRGSVIATAELIGCHEIYESNTLVAERLICINGHPVSRTEQLFGDWTPGRYAWEFANMKMLDKPIPAKGRQGLWKWEGMGHE